METVTVSVVAPIVRVKVGQLDLIAHVHIDASQFLRGEALRYHLNPVGTRIEIRGDEYAALVGLRCSMSPVTALMNGNVALHQRARGVRYRARYCGGDRLRVRIYSGARQHSEKGRTRIALRLDILLIP